MEKLGVEVDVKIRYLVEKGGKIIFLNLIFLPLIQLERLFQNHI